MAGQTDNFAPPPFLRALSVADAILIACRPCQNPPPPLPQTHVSCIKSAGDEQVMS